MRVWPVLVLIAAVLSAGDDRPAHPVRDKKLHDQINVAIDKGVRYLKRIQRPAGYWGGYDDPKHSTGSFTGGYTALALYALAASGVPADDPSIRAGLAWIKATPQAFDGGASAGTYTNSTLVLALTRIDPAAHRRAIHVAADKLIGGQASDGMWTYTTTTTRTSTAARSEDRAAWRKGQGIVGTPDNSNTQFAVLALWAAQSMAEYKVPKKAWQRILKHFRKLQADDGGWPYRKVQRKSSTTMTAAGAVSLVYALAALNPDPKALHACRNDAQVRRALRILPLAPGKRRPPKLAASWHNYYWVYSIERVGTVLGLDPATWYAPGARFLVKYQGDDGRWPAPGNPSIFSLARPTSFVKPGTPTKIKANPGHYETALALLFLTRGTFPPLTGVITESGRHDDKPAVLTRKENFPDVRTAAGLGRAFGHYHAYKPDGRARVLKEFGKAGTAAVRLFVSKLRDGRPGVRATAYELLTKLVAKPFLFDPAAPFETRQVMLAPIDGWWKKHGAGLKWDPAAGRFVP